MKKHLISLFTIIVLIFTLNPLLAVNAEAATNGSDSTTTGFLKDVDVDCLETGNCTICEGYSVFITIINYILGIVGGIALAMFFIAGIYMMLGGAKTEYKKKAMDTIRYAIIGLALVFFSYVGVNLILNLLLGNDTTDTAKILGQDWTKLCN